MVPYIAVAIPQDFVQDVTELPAEDGAAGQWEAQSVRPEGIGSLLPVRPQDDSCRFSRQGTTNYHKSQWI